MNAQREVDTLLERRSAVFGEALALTATAVDEGRPFTADEQSRWALLNFELDVLYERLTFLRPRLSRHGRERMRSDIESTIARIDAAVEYAVASTDGIEYR